MSQYYYNDFENPIQHETTQLSVDSYGNHAKTSLGATARLIAESFEILQPREKIVYNTEDLNIALYDPSIDDPIYLGMTLLQVPEQIGIKETGSANFLNAPNDLIFQKEQAQKFVDTRTCNFENVPTSGEASMPQNAQVLQPSKAGKTRKAKENGTLEFLNAAIPNDLIFQNEQASKFAETRTFNSDDISTPELISGEVSIAQNAHVLQPTEASIRRPQEIGAPIVDETSRRVIQEDESLMVKENALSQRDSNVSLNLAGPSLGRENSRRYRARQRERVQNTIDETDELRRENNKLKEKINQLERWKKEIIASLRTDFKQDEFDYMMKMYDKEKQQST